MKNLLLLCLALSPLLGFAWQDDLKREITKIDSNFQGDIGVVIKNLNDGSMLEYNATDKWYLSSTIKIMVAISLMEEIQKGSIKLDQTVILQSKDFIDGAGPILWMKPGEKLTVNYILKAMLRESDNTAADLLIGLIGIEELNRDMKKWMSNASQLTSLLEVRYAAYSELHPKARSLSNMDFIFIKNFPPEKRHIEFAEKIIVPVSSLGAKNLEEAFEKYYAKGTNSATLRSYVELLEKLENGSLLSKSNTKLILNHMEHMKTGEHRIKAGLTSEYKFMQKTGTQIHRACNVGLIRKRTEQKAKIALAVCIKKANESINSDKVFKKIGQKLVESSLF